MVRIKLGDLRSAVQSLTGFDMRNPLYTSATAGESGITLGMKGQSGNVGIAIGTGANAKDRLSGTSSGASGQANNDVTNAIAIGTGLGQIVIMLLPSVVVLTLM